MLFLICSLWFQVLLWNMNKCINQASLWGRTHLWLDRRSENGSFNWHIWLFLFLIGSPAWWSRNSLTWSADVKPVAVRLGARSITAAARRQTAAVRWTKSLDRFNPSLRNLHWVYGFDSGFIKLLKVWLPCAHPTGTQYTWWSAAARLLHLSSSGSNCIYKTFGWTCTLI